MTSGNTAVLEELEVRNKAKASRKPEKVKEINFLHQNGRTGALKRATSRVTSLAAAATFSGAEGTMSDLQHKSKSGKSKSMMDSVKGAFKHHEDDRNEDDSAQYLLEIQTDPGGFNSGRTYTFRSLSVLRAHRRVCVRTSIRFCVVRQHSHRSMRTPSRHRSLCPHALQITHASS